ncbi:TylF/MycF family methyltransferase [Saccharopolyspora phatthalungensis]|uniref:Macrocin O-methyltransferase n=1 Tax=Saccharopolyspora phatthalungensis TaxID=664693 RepID=A0A840QJN7_9PSEU|nr:TylF/MycF family methyltransferase [Saccharopolyspora phatthalungensis]MBB5159508.1 hypothetical protein [Saccharopolyspora phatthalungensis]
MDGNAERYLGLLKKTLTNVIYEDTPTPNPWLSGGTPYDASARIEGRDWPSAAHTMVGLKRLDSLHECLNRVLADNVPGDFIETGVWRGGVCIFMRAFLAAHECTDRTVWVADSFEGFPDVAQGSHELDREIPFQEANEVVAVPLATVQDNFNRYGLLDSQVKFLRGWFKETLPRAPMTRLALLRLDGDLYESTADGLENLYPKLSPGGFVIVDDYALPSCRQAVHEFRERNGIQDPIENIDYTGVFWRRSA